jgi:signal transduction histidine kinase
LRRSLLLAVKEAVGNVARHSDAEKMVLRIGLKDSSLAVTVEDNGKGFDPDKITAGRNGLGNMVHRMKEIGGDCRIVSAPGAGCRVEFSIPLARRRPQIGWLMRGLGRKQKRGATSVPTELDGKPL